jgi:hypothetical protein
MHMSEFDTVADEIGEAKRAFHAMIWDAYQAGMSIPRIIGLVGWSTGRHVLGDDVVSPFDNRPRPAASKPASPPPPKVPGASPLMMPRRNT